MPYFDPASSYVLWSSLYLLTLGVVSFAAAHNTVYRFSNCKRTGQSRQRSDTPTFKSSHVTTFQTESFPLNLEVGKSRLEIQVCVLPMINDVNIATTKLINVVLYFNERFFLYLFGESELVILQRLPLPRFVLGSVGQYNLLLLYPRLNRICSFPYFNLRLLFSEFHHTLLLPRRYRHTHSDVKGQNRPVYTTLPDRT